MADSPRGPREDGGDILVVSTFKYLGSVEERKSDSGEW